MGLLEFVFEKTCRVALSGCHHLFWCAGRHHRTAAATAFRPHIDKIVGHFDHVEVVFDDYYGVPFSTKRLSTSMSARISSKCNPVVGSSRI